MAFLRLVYRAARLGVVRRGRAVDETVRWAWAIKTESKRGVCVFYPVASTYHLAKMLLNLYILLNTLPAPLPNSRSLVMLTENVTQAE